MTISAGTFVKMRHGGKTVKGKVVSVHTSSSVPKVDNDTITGTDDAPAARVQHFAQTDAGWAATQTHTAHLVAGLTSIAPLGKTRSLLHPTHAQPSTERRVVKIGEVRVVPDAEADGQHQFWARVVNYGVVDDYGTTWAPGVFAESAAARLPRYLYGHAGWSTLGNVLGRGIDYKEAAAGTLGATDPGGFDVLFQLDDFDAVPSCRQVWSQLQSGTLDEFSVGFERLSDEPDPRYEANLGVVRITKARLFEVSSVIEGAVPGTQILAMSRAARTDPQAAVLMQYLDGRATFDDAQRALADLEEVRSPGDEDDVSQWIASIDATLDEALGYLNGLDDLPPEVAQARDLVSAASEIIDQLMEAMGIPDPDDEDDTAGAPDTGNLAPPSRAVQDEMDRMADLALSERALAW